MPPFLTVTTISDISLGDGLALSDDVFVGKVQYKTSCDDWPAQAGPPKSEWDFWASKLRRHFALEHSKLTTPLGAWILTDEQEYYTSWEWWLDEKDSVFRFMDKKWYRIKQVRNTSNRRHNKMAPSYLVAPKDRTFLPHRPMGIVCTSISTIVNNRFETTGTAPRLLFLPAPLFPAVSFVDHLQSHTDNWLFQACTLYTTLPLIVGCLFHRDLTAVSDGSYDPHRQTGSTAWCLATASGSILMAGGGMIPGHKGHQSAYRSKAGGILGPVTICCVLESLFKPSNNHPLVIACDGEGALFRSVSMPREKVSSSLKHADLISRVQDRLCKTKYIPQPIHVHGHRLCLRQEIRISVAFPNCPHPTMASRL